MNQPVADDGPAPADADGPAGSRVVVTLVHSPACHFCEDAERTLTEMAGRYPLTLDLVDIRSERGGALVRAHRPAMNPLVLLDGEYFSVGRLPRRKLERTLDGRLGAASGLLLADRRSVR